MASPRESTTFQGEPKQGVVEVKPDAVSTKTRAYLELSLSPRGPTNIINLPIPYQLGTPVNGPIPLAAALGTVQSTRDTLLLH